MKNKLKIVHLYPQEMNIYGDRGNVVALTKRLEWRGFEADVIEVGIGEKFDFSSADIIFAGGGQDHGQIAVGYDLQKHATSLKQAAKDGVVMLTICGSYQLFGHGFQPKNGTFIPGIGIFDAKTVASEHRMIGNIVVESDFGRLIGFENHSGETILASNQPSLGSVIKGFGNDYTTLREGAVANNAYGTYLHGSLLPKNPDFTDHLLLLALKRAGQAENLEPLDNSVERAAAKVAFSRK